jgi:uncharacterized Tic20 family protein
MPRVAPEKRCDEVAARPVNTPARRESPEENLQPMTIADDLQKLDQLRGSGALNDDEFALAKAKVLNGPSDLEPAWAAIAEADVGPEKHDRQTRQWAFILHLSVLAGFLVPLAGLVVPFVIWQLKKDELPGIDAHGKNAVNWILSGMIYGVVSVLLVFVIIGIPMLMALGALGVVFPIIAGIKANDGELWKYPMSITFLK